MKNLFASDSPLMNLLRQFADLIILNLLWLLGCLPIITIGTSTTALYQSLMKLRKDDGLQVWADFWRFYRSNFTQATVLFVVIVGICLISVADVMIIFTRMSNAGMPLRFLLILPLFLIIPSLSYIFPLQAQFENRVFITLKNAWIMSLSHYLTSVIVLIFNLIPIAVLLFLTDWFLEYLPIWLGLSGSVIAYINTFLLQRIFNRYIPSEGSQ